MSRLSVISFLSRAFTLLSVSIYCSLAWAALPNHPTYDEIIERGTINIAVYENFAPFSSRVDGKLVGLDIDIAELIAEKLGVKATFRELPAGETVDDDLRNAIWKGHYMGGGISDLMMHVPVDREFARRNNMVVIFGAYYDEQLVMARNLEKTGETPTLAVYRYEKVGVELDSLPDFFLSGYRGGMLRENVVHFFTIPEAAESLEAGEIAAIFASRSQIESALQDKIQNYDIGPVAAPELARDRWSLGVAVSTHTRQLGYAIEDILYEIVQNDEIKALFSRYGLTYTKPER